MLRAILYISDSTLQDQQIEQEQLNNIRTTSKKTNHDNELSGVLAFHQKQFFHVLEGRPEKVEALLKIITTDQRNKNLSILLDVASDERIYDDWNLIETHSQKQSKLLGLFLQRHIDLLPMLEQQQHDNLESFINNIFY